MKILKPPDNIRIDQLLFYLRFYKTRSISSKEIEKGSCYVNGNIVKKKNKLIYNEDLIKIRKGPKFWLIKIISLPNSRGPYRVIKECYKDISPSITNNKINFIQKISSGRRPTKSDRRKLDKFTGRD